jgi:hypothetical protein
MTKETEMTDQTKNRWAWRRGLAVGVLALGGVLHGCGGGGPPPPACDPPAIGVTWIIDKAATGARLSCAQAAATEVDLNVNNTAFPADCNAGQVLTTTLAPGNYNVDLTLLGPDANGTLQILSQTPTMTVQVLSCGVTDLGDVPFDVN